MLAPVRSTQFRRDVTRVGKRGKNLGKLREVPHLLIHQEPLSARHRDHALKGSWNGYREVHIEPDWLLVYRVEGANLLLVRTGSHADLFE